MTVAYDLAVIGAGPAGMAAAVAADGLGLATVLVDEQATPGGQIYRNIEGSPLADRAVLGADYAAGAALVAALRGSGVAYLDSATVWRVGADNEIGVTHKGVARLMRAKRVILATGAIERPVPLPGWTLPGVMTAGAAQVMLKSAAAVAPGAVFAGSGPLLYLIVGQYLRAGAPVAALIDTTPRVNTWRAAPKLPLALTAGNYLAKGLALMRDIGRAGVRVIRGVDGLAALGEGRLSAVAYARGGRRETIETEHLFLHQGVVANVNLAMAAGCAHHWDARQLGWRPVCDDWGRSSVDGVSIAGDGAGIGGAKAAELGGRLAALDAACRRGRIDAAERDRRAAPLHAARRRDLRIRPFLETLYRPANSLRIPAADDVTVCRCEEVTVGDIRAALALGCPGPNQLKAFTRCGMGPCQGRLCGPTVSELIAAERGVPVADVGYYRLRPPVKPVTLGELAGVSWRPGDA